MPDWIPKVHDEVGKMLVESLKVPLWNGKLPVKDSMSNKSERIYKVDQAIESHLLLQLYVKSWVH